MVDEPRAALMYRSSTPTLLADSGPFRGILLTIWGPGAIFMVAEAQGALTCRLSTLAILADSDPFHGLLLTVLGSRSDLLGL